MLPFSDTVITPSLNPRNRLLATGRFLTVLPRFTRRAPATSYSNWQNLLDRKRVYARCYLLGEPADLTFHVAALPLAHGRDGNRFIITIPGRGYQFVALAVKPNSLSKSDRNSRTD
jgi:hypothetical protein